MSSRRCRDDLVSGVLRQYLADRNALRIRVGRVLQFAHTRIADPEKRLHAFAQANSVAEEHSSAIGASLLQDLVVSNVPGPHVPVSILGSKVESMYPLIHGSGLNITAMSPRGKLDIGLVASPDVLPDLPEMADECAMAMEELFALAQ